RPAPARPTGCPAGRRAGCRPRPAGRPGRPRRRRPAAGTGPPAGPPRRRRGLVGHGWRSWTLLALRVLDSSRARPGSPGCVMLSITCEVIVQPRLRRYPSEVPSMTTPQPLPRPVGEQLRQWRERRRLTQLDLALQADISTRHLSFVETGRSRPSRDMLLRLAEQLEVPLRERNQ